MNYQKYDKLAFLFDPLEKMAEKWSGFGEVRQKYIGPLSGKILEIGVGSGANLRYYSNNAEVFGVEPSPKMLARAKKKLAALKNPNITLELGRAKELRFPDNYFDYVVSSLVFCSVDEPLKAISEVKRVLKSGGKTIFIEHVPSQNKTLNFMLKTLNPLQKAIVGCDLQRDTGVLIRQSGLKLLKEENIKLKDVFRYFETEK